MPVFSGSGFLDHLLHRPHFPTPPSGSPMAPRSSQVAPKGWRSESRFLIGPSRAQPSPFGKILKKLQLPQSCPPLLLIPLAACSKHRVGGQTANELPNPNRQRIAVIGWCRKRRQLPTQRTFNKGIVIKRVVHAARPGSFNVPFPKGA